MSFAEAQSILIDLDVKLSRCNGDGGVFLRSDGIARSGRFLNSEDETRRELAKARAIIICYGKLNTLSYDTNILLKKQWVKMPVAKGEYEYTESDCYAQKNLTFCIYTSDESPLQLSFKDGIGLAELR